MTDTKLSDDRLNAIRRGIEPIDDDGTLRPGVNREHVIELLDEVLRLRTLLSQEKPCPEIQAVNLIPDPPAPVVDIQPQPSEPESTATTESDISDAGSVTIE